MGVDGIRSVVTKPRGMITSRDFRPLDLRDQALLMDGNSVVSAWVVQNQMEEILPNYVSYIRQRMHQLLDMLENAEGPTCLTWYFDGTASAAKSRTVAKRRNIGMENFNHNSDVLSGASDETEGALTERARHFLAEAVSALREWYTIRDLKFPMVQCPHEADPLLIAAAQANPRSYIVSQDGGFFLVPQVNFIYFGSLYLDGALIGVESQFSWPWQETLTELFARPSAEKETTYIKLSKKFTNLENASKIDVLNIASKKINKIYSLCDDEKKIQICRQNGTGVKPKFILNSTLKLHDQINTRRLNMLKKQRESMYENNNVANSDVKKIKRGRNFPSEIDDILENEEKKSLPSVQNQNRSKINSFTNSQNENSDMSSHCKQETSLQPTPLQWSSHGRVVGLVSTSVTVAKCIGLPESCFFALSFFGGNDFTKPIIRQIRRLFGLEEGLALPDLIALLRTQVDRCNGKVVIQPPEKVPYWSLLDLPTQPLTSCRSGRSRRNSSTNKMKDSPGCSPIPGHVSCESMVPLTEPDIRKQILNFGLCPRSQAELLDALDATLLEFNYAPPPQCDLKQDEPSSGLVGSFRMVHTPLYSEPVAHFTIPLISDLLKSLQAARELVREFAPSDEIEETKSFEVKPLVWQGCGVDPPVCPFRALRFIQRSHEFVGFKEVEVQVSEFTWPQFHIFFPSHKPGAALKHYFQAALQTPENRLLALQLATYFPDEMTLPFFDDVRFPPLEIPSLLLRSSPACSSTSRAPAACLPVNEQSLKLNTCMDDSELNFFLLSCRYWVASARSLKYAIPDQYLHAAIQVAIVLQLVPSHRYKIEPSRAVRDGESEKGFEQESESSFGNCFELNSERVHNDGEDSEEEPEKELERELESTVTFFWQNFSCYEALRNLEATLDARKQGYENPHKYLTSSNVRCASLFHGPLFQFVAKHINTAIPFGWIDHQGFSISDLYTGTKFSQPLTQVKDQLQQYFQLAKDAIFSTLKPNRPVHVPSKFVPSKPHKIKMYSTKKLPIDDYTEKILKTVCAKQVSIITGPTGCGKSTRVPQMLAKLFGAYVVVVVPLVIHARQLSEWTMKQMDEEAKLVEDAVSSVAVPPNNENKQQRPTVGFCPRRKRDWGRKITYVTNAWLLDALARNPRLLCDRGVTHIILDEVHERPVDSDLVFARVRQLLTSESDLSQLRLILMSATYPASPLGKYFIANPNNTPIPVNVRARPYPVKMHYLDDPLAPFFFYHLSKVDVKSAVDFQLKYKRKYNDASLVLPVLKALLMDLHACNMRKHSMLAHNKDALAELHTDVLVFLPTLTIWEDVYFPNMSVFLLVDDEKDGNLKSLSEPSSSDATDRFLTRVVLATSSCESALTLARVRWVVDLGMKTQVCYDDQRRTPQLTTQLISRASAKQRRGRCGRTAEGDCFRLYPRSFMKKDKQTGECVLPPDVPEIRRVPLSTSFLMLKRIEERARLSITFNDFVHNDLETKWEDPRVILRQPLGNIVDLLASTLDKPRLAPARDAALKLLEMGALKNDSKIDDSRLRFFVNLTITPLGHFIARLPLTPEFGHMAAISMQLGSQSLPHVLLMSVLVEEQVYPDPHRSRSFAQDTLKQTATRVEADRLDSQHQIGSDMIALTGLIVLLLNAIEARLSAEHSVENIVEEWCRDHRVQSFRIWSALRKLAEICKEWPSWACNAANRNYIHTLQALSSLRAEPVHKFSQVKEWLNKKALPILRLEQEVLDLLHLVLLKSLWSNLVRLRVLPRKSTYLTGLSLEHAQKIQFLEDKCKESTSCQISVRLCKTSYSVPFWGQRGFQTWAFVEELAYRRLATYEKYSKTYKIDLGVDRLDSPESARIDVTWMAQPDYKTFVGDRSILTTLLQSSSWPIPHNLYGIVLTKSIRSEMFSLLPEDESSALALLIAAPEPLVPLFNNDVIVGIRLPQSEPDALGATPWENYLPLPFHVPTLSLNKILQLRQQLHSFPGFTLSASSVPTFSVASSLPLFQDIYSGRF